jgi:hypothetical protein
MRFKTRISVFRCCDTDKNGVRKGSKNSLKEPVGEKSLQKYCGLIVVSSQNDFRYFHFRAMHDPTVIATAY